MKATLSEKGQITIPKKLRQSLGLKPGTVLDFTEDEGRLIAAKAVEDDPLSKWRGVAKIPVGKDTASYLKEIRGR